MKGLRTIFIVTLLLLFYATLFPVNADMGPKPSLKIIVKNPSDDAYYLDLLIREEGDFDNLGEDRQNYDKNMLELLSSQEINGWYPALTHGTKNVPLFGKLTGNPEGKSYVHSFSYMGVPNDFKIILVTKGGLIQVSDEIHTFLFQTTITYDMSSGSVVAQSIVSAYLSQFSLTFIPTLLLEALILYLMKLWTKRNLKTILVVNLTTQLFMSAIAGTALLKLGILSAFILLIPVEIAILIIETIAYRCLLKDGENKKYILYAVVANLNSAALGFILIIYESILILK